MSIETWKAFSRLVQRSDGGQRERWKRTQRVRYHCCSFVAKILRMCQQRADELTGPVPQDLHADTDQKKREELQENIHPGRADRGAQPIRKGIAKIYAHGYEGGSNGRCQKREQFRTQLVRFVGTQSDGDGNRAGADG